MVIQYHSSVNVQNLTLDFNHPDVIDSPSGNKVLKIGQIVMSKKYFVHNFLIIACNHRSVRQCSIKWSVI